MGKELLKEEVKNISLDEGQELNLNNHFDKISDYLRKLGFNNIQKQGSYGRHTIIKGREEEADGFDLDIAVVVVENSDLYRKTQDIYNYLSLYSEYKNREIKINKKAITINVRSNFSIDITLIVQQGGKEFVYNNQTGTLEDSGALLFKNAYNAANKDSTNNSLRDLSKIYKHVRDSIKDFKVPSIVLDILLYGGQPSKSSYEEEMINTLKNVEIQLRGMKKNHNFQSIVNPIDKDDLIDTKLRTEEDIENLIKLNTLVLNVVQGAILKGTGFSSLKAKYYKLDEISRNYADKSFSGGYTSSLVNGVFGGIKME